MRRRRERKLRLMTAAVDAKAAEFLGTGTGVQEQLLVWQTCGGPDCRVVLWAGIRRRRTVRYCSGRCRQAAYRARKRWGDDDVVP